MIGLFMMFMIHFGSFSVHIHIFNFWLFFLFFFYKIFRNLHAEPNQFNFFIFFVNFIVAFDVQLRSQYWPINLYLLLLQWFKRWLRMHFENFIFWFWLIYFVCLVFCVLFWLNKIFRGVRRISKCNWNNGKRKKIFEMNKIKLNEVIFIYFFKEKLLNFESLEKFELKWRDSEWNEFI